MNKIGLALGLAMLAPMAANAATTTIVVPGGGPYDITSSNLFAGVALSSADGAGSFTIDFTTSQPASADDTPAQAEATVTVDIATFAFSNLRMSWFGGPGIAFVEITGGTFQLDTTFSDLFRNQQLVFDWTDSTAGAGFDFSVTAQPGGGFQTVIPIPAPLGLLAAAMLGIGFVARRRAA